MAAKQPVGVMPITVPTVAKVSDRVTGEAAFLVVSNLRTYDGPTAYNGRHARMRLTTDQAEVLVRELAVQLGLEVTP